MTKEMQQATVTIYPVMIEALQRAHYMCSLDDQETSPSFEKAFVDLKRAGMVEFAEDSWHVTELGQQAQVAMANVLALAIHARQAKTV